MKTLIFNGSPRIHGDTTSLIERLRENLEGQVMQVDAYTCGIKPCMDCRYCWKSPGCCIQDEMQEVYRYIEACDNIVIASPIYFSEIAGQLLAVASRLQAYYTSRQFRKEELIRKTKKGAVILVGGGDGTITKPYETAVTLLHHMNAYEIHPVVFSHGTNNRPAIDDPAAVEGVLDICKYFRAIH